MQHRPLQRRGYIRAILGKGLEVSHPILEDGGADAAAVFTL